MQKLSSWLGSYWWWVSQGGIERRIVGIGGPVAVVLVIAVFVFGSGSETPDTTDVASTVPTSTVPSVVQQDPTAPPGPVATAEPREHTIQSGESLSVICTEQVPELDLDACIDEIVALNGLADPGQIAAGDVLQLPNGAASDSAQQPQPTEAPSATTPGGAFSLDDAAVSALLTTTYKIPPGGPAPDADLPFAPGAVEARWYKSGDRYVVYYHGLTLNDGHLYCPGNSIQAGSSFQYVSNSPAIPGACEGASTLATEGAAGVYLCDGFVMYLTQIPSTSQGDLYGTVEIFEADGTLIGLTSVASTSLGDIPEVDLGPCSGPVR